VASYENFSYNQFFSIIGYLRVFITSDLLLSHLIFFIISLTSQLASNRYTIDALPYVIDIKVGHLALEDHASHFLKYFKIKIFQYS